MEETLERKPYVRPMSTCTVVRLESPICSGSEFQVASPDNSDKGIESQKVNGDFAAANDFEGLKTPWSTGGEASGF